MLMMIYIFQKRNKRGEGYGWHLAALETPETKWGYDFIGSRYSEKPEESWKAIRDRMLECFPDARETEIQKMLCIRYPDGKAILQQTKSALSRIPTFPCKTVNRKDRDSPAFFVYTRSAVRIYKYN